MKAILLSAVLVLPLSAEENRIPNPAIDYEAFDRLVAEIAPIREKNRVTEDQFIAMAAEPGTVIRVAPPSGLPKPPLLLTPE